MCVCSQMLCMWMWKEKPDHEYHSEATVTFYQLIEEHRGIMVNGRGTLSCLLCVHVYPVVCVCVALLFSICLFISLGNTFPLSHNLKSFLFCAFFVCGSLNYSLNAITLLCNPNLSASLWVCCKKNVLHPVDMSVTVLPHTACHVLWSD